MTDPQQGGHRQVFQGTDGKYYTEASPGSGPRHHDDLPLRPGDVEAKAHGDQVPDAMPNTITPGATAPGILPDYHDGPAVSVPLAFGVLDAEKGRRGGLLAAYGPDDRPRAEQHARNVGGLLVGLPLLADYS